MARTREELDRTDEIEEQVPVEDEAPGIGEAEPPSGEGPQLPEEETEGKFPVGRLAAVAVFPTLAAAVMVGGVFTGASPRFWAGVAGGLGIAAAVWIRRLRNPIVMNIGIALGVLFVGIILAAPGGSVGDVLNLGPFLREAVTSGEVQRPPVEFTLGWRAILGWLMGGLGLAAAWVGIELRRPALGLLIPLPVIAVSAISIPDEQRVASGIAALALFAIGLGLLSGIDLEEGGEQRSLAFELRRAARALPLIGVITVGLFFLAQANVLFPAPLYDPTQSAREPETVPLSDVPDRVLFSVKSQVTGPWRMGSLDVYDGDSWKLPPFAENRTQEVPESGIIDPELRPGVRADFRVEGLNGAVLPGLPNLVGLVAEGPELAYDQRTGVIRLAEGSIQTGLEYTVTAARIPSVQELQSVDVEARLPDELVGVDSERFLDIPPPPPAVQDLLRRAPNSSDWDTLNFMRNEFLDTVVASGAGQPKAVSPERVQDMLAGSQEGTPYEIVAAQAMLARWAGVPSRIGYGFDGGEQGEGGFVEVRPIHGASFLEVYFPGYKWLPLIGTPQQAKASFGEEEQQFNQNVLASDEFAASLYVPTETDPRSFLFEQIRAIFSIVLPVLLLALLVYFGYPAVRKAYLRARRRSWAQGRGPEARIALAYAELRDLATDFGYRYHDDTPLMFLDRVVPDQEHMELAWLVTRTMWGDLQQEITEEDTRAAEELSGTLKKRLSQAHPFTLRFIAALSRLSLRYPYAPQINRLARRNEKDAARKEGKRALART